MRRPLPFAVLASLLASCVAVETPVDPRGSVRIGQRVVVMVHQSPGPWIVADPDNKAETALKLLPLGNFLVGMQEERVNEVSKELQPYLPRPRYDQLMAYGWKLMLPLTLANLLATAAVVLARGA